MHCLKLYLGKIANLQAHNNTFEEPVDHLFFQRDWCVDQRDNRGGTSVDPWETPVNEEYRAVALEVRPPRGTWGEGL